MSPLAIDLFCGLGGWSGGLFGEGYRVVGFDNARHVYGEARYPGQLVIQDVLTLHGSQFKDAALIVASPPCQAYSYRAMPWKKAKALPPPDNTLFEACFRIQREAEDAAGGPIPMVVENVCGAQKWVGRARWHYGSFYLWGDVPALMPITRRAKVGGFSWSDFGKPDYKPQAFNGTADKRLREASEYLCDCGHAKQAHVYETDECEECSCVSFLRGAKRFVVDGVKVASEDGRRTDIGKGARFTSRDCGMEGIKNTGGSWFSVAHNTTSGVGRNPTRRNDPRDGIKQGGDCFNASQPSISRLCASKSSARKAASAHIAKIPYDLSRWIAHAWKPTEAVQA